MTVVIEQQGVQGLSIKDLLDEHLCAQVTEESSSVISEKLSLVLGHRICDTYIHMYQNSYSLMMYRKCERTC